MKVDSDCNLSFKSGYHSAKHLRETVPHITLIPLSPPQKKWIGCSSPAPLALAAYVSSTKTGTKLDELSFVVRLRRRIAEDYPPRRKILLPYKNGQWYEHGNI